MEEHRLTVMQPGYDEKLFNQLYKDTEALRIKLTRQINPSLYSIEHDDIMSWFDVKFIFTFNKYYGKVNDGYLKGNIIQSLSFFKQRILRNLYAQKNQIYNSNNTVDIQEVYNLSDSSLDHRMSGEELYRNLALAFLKDSLSRDAYTVLKIQLTPPLYILERLPEKYTKIPKNLVKDYLGISITKLNQLYKEIEAGVLEAKFHFRPSV
jgi:hypothetical protein